MPSTPAVTINLPTSAAMMLVERDLIPQLTLDDPILQRMPIKGVDAPYVMWDIKDNIGGLQQLRGLDGNPNRVLAMGSNRYQYEPGYYGEKMDISESELTLLRAPGSMNMPIEAATLVADRQQQLLVRRLTRIRKTLWDVVTGIFSIAGPQGIQHRDEYAVQKLTGSDWSTVATGTPLADFRAAQLLGRGRSCSFGGRATAFMNRKTFNYLAANTNAADMAGKRTSGLAQPIGLEAMNQVLLSEDLPRIQVYDEGYLTDDGATSSFTPFIADDKVILMGYRPGQVLGNYVMTRNATNPNMSPGPYVMAKDDQGPPRKIEVHDGHNGGPAIYYPGDVIYMSV